MSRQQLPLGDSLIFRRFVFDCFMAFSSSVAWALSLCSLCVPSPHSSSSRNGSFSRPAGSFSHAFPTLLINFYYRPAQFYARLCYQFWMQHFLHKICSFEVFLLPFLKVKFAFFLLALFPLWPFWEREWFKAKLPPNFYWKLSHVVQNFLCFTYYMTLD